MPLVETAAGPVEVEERGSGTPVLVLHGTPGGIDVAEVMVHFLPKDQFRSILLSRPGYLGTPLPAGEASFDREAELLAAVLDSVGVERVGVLAWSGGGPPAYRFAALHPDRVAALVAVAAVSQRYLSPQPSFGDRVNGTSPGKALARLAAKFAPGRLVRAALASEATLRGAELAAAVAAVAADRVQRAAVLAFATDRAHRGARIPGWYNDETNLAAIESLELERVSCPVLLVHGDADSDVPIEHSRSALALLSNARLLVAERGSHLALWAHPDAAKLQDQVRTFLAAPS